MSGHDSKYFSTTKTGEMPELKEELNSQYKRPINPWGKAANPSIWCCIKGSKEWLVDGWSSHDNPKKQMNYCHNEVPMRGMQMRGMQAPGERCAKKTQMTKKTTSGRRDLC
ncbi:uncharacterized protein LOC131164284 [Malania oleifera]|uniref:uncharacterized protein LOC131164284 n=1 Tax=Malania oleifera TaxID=397392 RepID=UPI0025AE6616|nr:uncharacterized protein LOC131164284 [Malania oleifera]